MVTTSYGYGCTHRDRQGPVGRLLDQILSSTLMYSLRTDHSISHTDMCGRASTVLQWRCPVTKSHVLSSHHAKVQWHCMRWPCGSVAPCMPPERRGRAGRVGGVSVPAATSRSDESFQRLTQFTADSKSVLKRMPDLRTGHYLLLRTPPLGAGAELLRLHFVSADSVQ